MTPSGFVLKSYPRASKGGLFPACIHRPLQEEDRNKLWFTPGSEEYEAVCKVVEDRFLLKDVRKLSPLYQTSVLEVFHSLIVRFCPKHTAFSWLGMYCNPNISVQFPKAKKGEYSIKVIKQESTYGKYCLELVEKDTS
ncbi:hypothetical protein ACOMHN_062208 [Nucella lapillus]